MKSSCAFTELCVSKTNLQKTQKKAEEKHSRTKKIKVSWKRFLQLPPSWKNTYIKKNLKKTQQKSIKRNKKRNIESSRYIKWWFKFLKYRLSQTLQYTFYFLIYSLNKRYEQCIYSSGGLFFSFLDCLSAGNWTSHLTHLWKVTAHPEN